IKAFNAHSWEDVKACIAPDVEIYVRGKLDIKDNWEQLEKNYRTHWAMPNGYVDVLKLEEFDHGVDVEILDRARQKVIDVRYTYAQQGGKWLQIKHEIDNIRDAAQ
ncbi:hypothetical protein M408DRAFT_331241, partial [Serendipita vermifera MAFF 305830]